MLGLTSPVVALLTPFNAEGKIDWQAFKTYLTALFSWGIRSVVANGTTGEFPSLTLEERQEVIEFVKSNFPGTIVNNVSSTCIGDVKMLVQGTHGYGDTILILPPYYYAKASNDGLCQFFEKALLETSLPILLYNFPKHSGNCINNGLLEMLLEKGIGITGIKDSSGEMENAVAYKSHFPELAIFFASESGALEALQNGLSGIITGGANPLPEFLIAMQKYIGESEDRAQLLQRSFNVWNDYRKRSSLFEIPLLKAAMGARIKDFPIYVRAPFTHSPDEALSQIQTVVMGCLADFYAIIDERVEPPG